jgi:hypothetical protein
VSDEGGGRERPGLGTGKRGAQIDIIKMLITHFMYIKDGRVNDDV